VADNEADGFGRNAQPPGHFFLVAADEQAQDLLLEAVGVAGVLALEGWDDILAVVTPRAAVEGRLISPEAGLAADVQVADDLYPVAELEVGLVLPPTAVAATALG
jgi:hypothetical protein